MDVYKYNLQQCSFLTLTISTKTVSSSQDLYIILFKSFLGLHLRLSAIYNNAPPLPHSVDV